MQADGLWGEQSPSTGKPQKARTEDGDQFVIRLATGQEEEAFVQLQGLQIRDLSRHPGSLMKGHEGVEYAYRTGLGGNLLACLGRVRGNAGPSTRWPQ